MIIRTLHGQSAIVRFHDPSCRLLPLLLNTRHHQVAPITSSQHLYYYYHRQFKSTTTTATKPAAKSVSKAPPPPPTTDFKPPLPPKRISATSSSSSSQSRSGPGGLASPNVPTIDNPVNAPATTRPPPLEPPPWDPQKSRFANLFAQGKTYLDFYKTGIVNTFNNWRAVDDLRVKHGVHNTHPEVLFDAVVAHDSAFTRSDYQLMKRGTRDMKRLIPFGFLLIVTGELMPLVVIFLNSLSPKSVWIPAQFKRDREKRARRRQETFKRLQELRERVEEREKVIAEINALKAQGEDPTPAQQKLFKMKAPPPAPMTADGSQPLTATELEHMTVSTGIGAPWILSIGFGQMWILRLQRHLQYILLDDMLIYRGGGVKAMIDEEVELAADERGLDVLGVELPVLRGRLENWVEIVTNKSKIGFNQGFLAMAEMLLTPPDEWEELVKKSREDLRAAKESEKLPRAESVSEGEGSR